MSQPKLVYKSKNVIQFMIARGCVEDSEFRDMLCKMLNLTQLDEEKVFTVVQQINIKLNPFNMMIRIGIDEISTLKYYVLISTVDNQITRVASLHNPKELELFKSSLQTMVNDSRCTMLFHGNSSTTFTGIAIRVGVPVSDRRKLFDAWCRKHWFKELSDDEVTLGVRTMAELDVFIKEHLLEDPSHFDNLVQRQQILRNNLLAKRRQDRPSVIVKQQRA